MKTRAYVRLLPALALLGAVGCALQQEQVEQSLARPPSINCKTAQGDIRLLQQEKANVVERIAEGATSIYPASLVVGVVTGTEETKLDVAIGDYNNKIDARIAEIKQTCGIP